MGRLRAFWIGLAMGSLFACVVLREARALPDQDKLKNCQACPCKEVECVWGGQTPDNNYQFKLQSTMTLTKQAFQDIDAAQGTCSNLGYNTKNDSVIWRKFNVATDACTFSTHKATWLEVKYSSGGEDTSKTDTYAKCDK